MNIFPIAPAESRYLWFLIPVVVILVGAIALVATSVRGAHASRFEIRPDGLRLEGDWYGRFIPKTQLRVDLARRVDLGYQEELRPRWRRLGTGLPGYQAGWFRLRNGEKALLYLTDRYDGLDEEQLRELRVLGERYCRPVVGRNAPVGAAT